MSVDKKWLFGPGQLEPMPLGMNCKPWFEERLPSKCLAKHKNVPLKLRSSLNSRRWVFIQEGLDDFRNGCRPCDNIIIRHPKDSFLPRISPKVLKPVRPPKSPNILPEEPRLRLVPSGQSLSKVLEEIRIKVSPPKPPSEETIVTKQYFTIYPQLEDEEEEMEEMLLSVIQGPYLQEKLKRSTLPWMEPLTQPELRRKSFPRAHPVEVFVTMLKKISDTREMEEEEERKKKKAKKKSPKASERREPLRNVPKVVREFCAWAIGLGEEDVTEAYVMKLFDISREYKPVYQTVRIRTIGQVPVQLRYNKALNEKQAAEFSVEEINWERILKKPPDPYKPIPMKIRYGAWYLKPYLWTKLVNDEPLLEPAVQRLRKRRPIPDILEDLYGTIAFKDYILSHDLEMPWILEKLFKTKGWTYDQVNTPMKKVLRKYPLLKEDSQEDPSLFV
ncbi:protein FAM47A-like [Sorex araneus]|uniref:protein FAM47A-like n=1 Tax=Sorex araneus TaxID=42254 RepID=UPI00064A20C6|nr:protein FAM47A-like [Sorex araneus]